MSSLMTTLKDSTILFSLTQGVTKRNTNKDTNKELRRAFCPLVCFLRRTGEESRRSSTLR